MPEIQRPRGFPRHFPVRADVGRTWRFHALAGIGWAATHAYLDGLLRIEDVGLVPRTGPLIIAANHLSNLDPILIGCHTPGHNAAMAKRELFERPAFAWLYGGANCFPVDRGQPDRRAIRWALDVLERGGRLILFIEGTRAPTPGMRRAEPGVGLLLRRRPVPVLPVGIWGTEKSLVRGRLLPRRVPVTLRFGEARPVDLDGHRRGSQAVADEVGRRVAALLPPAYRGVYAEPQAGTTLGPNR